MPPGRTRIEKLIIYLMPTLMSVARTNNAAIDANHPQVTACLFIRRPAARMYWLSLTM